MAFVNKKDLDDWKTLDEERDLILRSKGTNREQFSTFELTWGDHVVGFVLEKEWTGASRGDAVVNWSLNSIDLPEALQDQKEEVLRILVEALEAYGLSHERELAKEVHVHIPEHFL